MAGGSMSMPSINTRRDAPTIAEDGTVTPGKISNKLTFSGGIYGAIQEENEKYENTKKLAAEKNKIFEDNVDALLYLDRAKIIADNQQKAVEETDEFKYRTLEDDGLLNFAFSAINSGTYNDVRDKFEANTEVTPEEAAKVRAGAIINLDDKSKQINAEADATLSNIARNYSKEDIELYLAYHDGRLEQTPENQELVASKADVLDAIDNDRQTVENIRVGRLKQNLENSKDGNIDPYAEFDTDAKLAEYLNKENEKVVKRLEIVNNQWNNISARLNVSTDAKEEIVRNLYHSNRMEERAETLAKSIGKNVKVIDPVLINEYEQTIASIDGMRNNITSLVKDKAKKESILNRSTTILDKNTKALEEVSVPTNEMQSLLEDHSNAINELDDITQSLDKDLADVGEVSSANKDYKDYAVEMVAQFNKVNELSNTIEDYNTKLEALNNDFISPRNIEDLRQARIQLNAKLQDINNSLNIGKDFKPIDKGELFTSIDKSIKAKVDELRKQTDNLVKKQALTTEIKALNKAKENISKSLDVLAKKYKQLNASKVKLTKSVERGRNTYNNYINSISEAEANIADLEKQVSELKTLQDTRKQQLNKSADTSGKSVDELETLANNYIDQLGKFKQEELLNPNIDQIINDVADLQKLAVARAKFAQNYIIALRNPSILEKRLEEIKKEGSLTKEQRELKKKAAKIKSKLDKGIEFTDGTFFYSKTAEGLYTKYSKTDTGDRINVTEVTTEELANIETLTELQFIPEGAVRGFIGNEEGYIVYEKLDYLEEQLADQLRTEEDNAVQDDKLTPIADEDAVKGPESIATEEIQDETSFKEIQKEIAKEETIADIIKTYKYSKWDGFDKKTNKSKYKQLDLVEHQAKALQSLAKSEGYSSVRDMVISFSKKNKDDFAVIPVSEGFAKSAVLKDLISTNKNTGANTLTLLKTREFTQLEYKSIFLWKFDGEYDRDYPNLKKKKGQAKFKHPKVNGKYTGHLQGKDAAEVQYIEKTSSGRVKVKYKGQIWYANIDSIKFNNPNEPFAFFKHYVNFYSISDDGNTYTKTTKDGKATVYTKEEFDAIVAKNLGVKIVKDGKLAVVTNYNVAFNNAKGESGLIIPRHLEKLKIQSESDTRYIIKYGEDIGSILKKAMFTDTNGKTRELNPYEKARFTSLDDLNASVEDIESIIVTDPSTSKKVGIKDKPVLFKVGLLDQTRNFIGTTQKSETEAFTPSPGVQAAFDKAYKPNSVVSSKTGSTEGDLSGNYKKYIGSILESLKSKLSKEEYDTLGVTQGRSNLILPQESFQAVSSTGKALGKKLFLTAKEFQEAKDNVPTEQPTSTKSPAEKEADIEAFQMTTEVRSQNWINSQSQKTLSEHILEVYTGEELGYTEKEA